MVARVLAAVLLLSTASFAGLVDQVRIALARHDFSAADSALQGYRARQGATPEYLEALSWEARAALDAGQLDRAEAYARQTETLAVQQLKSRALDADKHLPIALGAAIEVQAQALAARGKNQQAATLLRRSLVAYGKTSIRARLQKNLNLLGLVGQPAPPLSVTQYLGPKPVPLSRAKGSSVLLFFWAHWCADCKAEGPVIGRLRAELASKGLTVVAPTQLYGYVARGEDASPQTELAYIEQVWQYFYPALQDVPVPVSQANFNTYGASTTPTLVLLDRSGRVALYHPGVMPYDQLRAAIEKTLAN
jgi:thiol-disulfide isomerase/thioredoxin